jgi:hypothetical protein
MAKVWKVALLTAFVLSLAGMAFAQTSPPLVGTYKTLTNTILPGRATESLPCDGCDGQLGNMIAAESWDEAALGTEWKVHCPQIGAPPVLLYDGVVDGTGQRIYQTSYSGGILWLSGAGAWGTGDPFYTGTITSFIVVATKQYVGGQLVGVVSSINFSGTIDGYDGCFTLAIANAELVGATPGTPALPGPFPPFMGPSDCAVTGSHGTYWDAHDITFSILGDCAVPTESSTWGQLKSLYR